MALKGGEIANSGGLKFNGFSDPVLSDDGAAMAWIGSVAGQGVSRKNSAALFWAPPGGAPKIVARVGGLEDGASGQRWERLRKVALGDSAVGPVFTASLVTGKGGGLAATIEGAWAVDSSGSLHLLFRDRDTIDGRTLSTFSVLTASVGTPARAGTNSHGVVVWLGRFSGGATRIMKTFIP